MGLCERRRLRLQPRAVLCADRVPIVRRYPSSQRVQPRARAASGRRGAGGRPRQGVGHRDWPAPAPCARGVGVGGGRGGGTTVRKGGARAAAAAPRQPHLAACAPVQPWLSSRWTPVPPWWSATRSPAQPPEQPLHRLRSPDRDPGRPEMIATGALLRVLLLLLAFGHSTYGEPPLAVWLAPPLGKPAMPRRPPCRPPHSPCPVRPKSRPSRLTLSPRTVPASSSLRHS